MCKRWQLLPGDRVLHFDELGNKHPTGTVSRVDPNASFFAYWVRWDGDWSKRLPEGAYPASAFHFTEMDRRGFCPEMTSERVRLLEELQAARRKKRNVGGPTSPPGE